MLWVGVTDVPSEEAATCLDCTILGEACGRDVGQGGIERVQEELCTQSGVRRELPAVSGEAALSEMLHPKGQGWKNAPAGHWKCAAGGGRGEGAVA